MDLNDSTSETFEEEAFLVNEDIGRGHSSDSCDPIGGFSNEDIEASVNNEPYIDMEFESEDAAYKFYNVYACQKGFSIRKMGGYKSTKTGKFMTARFGCSKAGFSQRQKEEEKDDVILQGQRTPEKVMPHRRSGCKASFYIKINRDEKWVLRTFNNVHNHDLIVSPSKKRFFLSQRFITTEQKKIIHTMSDQNMKVDQIMAVIAEKAGGMHNVRCTKKDVVNEIAAANRILRGVDVSQTLMYFSAIKKRDPYFFYMIEEDEDHTVRSIFWVDGRSRRAYERFGDVVTFDTTYCTNKYSMPFAPFLGVNHHGQTIFFGCALLRDEGKIRFEWLFNTWMKAMQGKHPTSIITDQDPAMKAAIEKIFPNTVHRCCQWHVMRKARDHLGVLYGQITKFKDDLFSCINGSLTIEQFEDNWREMVGRYKLETNSYLELMFNNRKRWVPAYFRDIFFANMSTTQRSEGMNFVLKGWVDAHTSIYKFVVQFEKMVQTIYAREALEDFKTMDEEPSLWSSYPIEAEARKIYTRNVFSTFKNRLRLSCQYSAMAIVHYSLYEVQKIHSSVAPNFFPVSYKVEIDIPNSKVSCDCKGFQFQGILCAHALRVMLVAGMHNLPEIYVLERWIKNANKGVEISSASTTVGKTLKSISARYGEIHALMSRIVEKSSKFSDAFELVMSKMKELDTELDLHVEAHILVEEEEEGGGGGGGEEEGASTGTIEENVRVLDVEYRDPPVSQCKGKRKPQRFKPPAEAKAKKMRTCSVCGKQEGHNFRTCPQRLKKNV